MITSDKYWTIENGVAVLHQQFGEAWPFDRASIEQAIINIKREEHLYASKAAFHAMLGLYLEGLEMMNAWEGKL